MKKTLTFVVACMFSVMMYAQKDVTKFLGIPVDGSRAAMIEKLKTKGFEYNRDADCLMGQFNGKESLIFIMTNNNKVCRISVTTLESYDEANTRIHYNNLCYQFKNNGKYISLDDYSISEDEDLLYEMTVHSKVYEACFYQNPEEVDSVAFIKEIQTELSRNFTEKELNNPTDKVKKEIISVALAKTFALIEHKLVWIRIVEGEGYNRFRIAINYENKYNMANGEDL